jgi:hypothetical protein
MYSIDILLKRELIFGVFRKDYSNYKWLLFNKRQKLNQWFPSNE